MVKICKVTGIDPHLLDVWPNPGRRPDQNWLDFCSSQNERRRLETKKKRLKRASKSK